MGVVIGYARVSTDGQSVHDQTVELKAAGASRTFAEKLSGAHSNRPMLRKALAARWLVRTRKNQQTHRSYGGRLAGS